MVKTDYPDMARIQPLLNTIYDATLDKSQWAVFFKHLLTTVGATSGTLLAHYTNTQKGISQITHHVGFEESVFSQYNQHYVNIDPFRPQMLNAPAGHTMFSHELIDDKEFARSEFYQDFLKHQGSRYTATQFVCKGPEQSFLIGLSREERLQPFEEEVKSILGYLQPHICRAIHITQKLTLADQDLAIRNRLLDNLSVGVMVIDKQGKVLSFNPKAEEMITRNPYIIIRNGKLDTLSEDENLLLNQAVQQACNSRNRLSASFQIGTVASRNRLHLSITPIDQTGAENSFDTPGGAAVIILTEPEKPANIPIDILQAMYDLSSAETRLAAELITGQPISEVAEKLRLSRNTLKTQCKSLYRKTGVGSQAALIRLVLTNARTTFYLQ